jgi:hypothetical protein
LPIGAELARRGYRVSTRLASPRDVIVPEWGLVSYIGLYTQAPARLSADLAEIAGVDFCTFLDRQHDEVRVVSRRGAATIRRKGDQYEYAAAGGDPLRLQPVLQKLGGTPDDRALFLATVEHDYPDALHRLWRAFHGLFTNTPDVLVSLEDGWYAGSRDIDRWIRMQAVHGNLLRRGSTAFVMTTLAPLPAPVRMEDLADELRSRGAALDRAADDAGAGRSLYTASGGM